MADPTLTRYAAPAAFRAAAEGFLLEREAENCLPLGLLPSLELDLISYGSQPYFAAVTEEGRVIGAAVMTPPFRVIIAKDSAIATIEIFARDLLQVEARPPGVIGPAAESLRFAETWQRLTGESFRLNTSERLYRLDEVQPPVGVPGELRRVGESDRPQLIEWLDAFYREAIGEDALEDAYRTAESMLSSPADVRGAFIWQDSVPVCLVGYSRPTVNGISIAPVYTPPRFRRRGYASAATAAVSQHLLDSGHRFCVLFTDLTNPTSNKIYQEIGYRPVCDFSEYVFTGEGGGLRTDGLA